MSGHTFRKKTVSRIRVLDLSSSGTKEIRQITVPEKNIDVLNEWEKQKSTKDAHEASLSYISKKK